MGRNEVMFMVGKPEKRPSLEDSHIDGRIILKLMFKKFIGAWNELMLLRTGAGGGVS
jgi:hypothetical protein